jgi:nucleoside-diphosphate-sugar epimerase
MKILVTGASGFIGRYCCSQLVVQGHEVHAVSSNYKLDMGYNWHKANLLDNEQTIKLMREIQPTHLLHLAWYAEPGKYWASVRNYHWVKASLTLFEQFSEFGGKRIVSAGTCAEYDWGYEKYVENMTPLKPVSLYGVCKHSLQMMLSTYASLNELSIAWGRVFSVYGPHEHSHRLCSSIIQQLIFDNKIKCNNADLVRDYLHVSDVAKAFVMLINSDLEGPVNIGSGVGIKLRDMVKTIEAKVGNFDRLEILNSPIASSSPRILVSNNERLKSIGWEPTYNLDEGLKDTISWFSEQNKL